MRQYKLAQLYSKCKDNGCLNPIDEKQIMMVKVFAMDLHLNFKNVDSLLKEAEIAYNKTQEELEQSRINAEKAAAIKNSEGIKLFTAKDNKTTLNVYRRVDGTLYALVNNDENRIYNISVKIFHGGVTYYKYVPSKTIYTGATVGGISTGGFHQTQDGYEAAKDKSDKGYFEINYGDNTITPKKVIVDDKIANLLKRDKDFTRYFKSKNSATCYNIYYDNSDDLQILAHITDQAAKMTFLSEMVDKGRLSYVDSKGIYNVIDRILRGSFPPPDEQIYNQALSLVHSNTTNEIKKGMDLLLSISDYKDSSQILEQARTKHKEILWKEKENKVIKKEKKAKKRKKCLIALIIIAITCIAAIIIVPKALYGSAQTAINEKDYDKANLLFTLLGDYQDSPEMLNETTYQNAKSLQDNKQYEEAFKLFDSLENYKDSIYQADISCYKLAEQFKESGNTEKAIETLDWSTFISDDELYNKVQKEKTQLRYDYILGHKDKNNQNTYDYLNYLMRNDKYKDEMIEIYNEIFGWSFSFIFNNDKNDTTTNKTEFSKYERIYLHVNSNGNPFENSKNLTCNVYSDSSDYSKVFINKNKTTFNAVNGNHSYAYWKNGFAGTSSTDTFRVVITDEFDTVVYETTIIIK